MPNNHFRVSYIIVILLVGALSLYLGFPEKKEHGIREPSFPTLRAKNTQNDTCGIFVFFDLPSSIFARTRNIGRSGHNGDNMYAALCKRHKRICSKSFYRNIDRVFLGTTFPFSFVTSSV